MHATIRFLHRSERGMPKDSVDALDVTVDGVVGDRQRDTRHHGGPQRAVCLFSAEVIDALRAEGHPILPGSTGENVTLGGVDWSALAPGTRLRFEQGVVLEVTKHAPPCRTIEASFTDGHFERIAQKEHPGQSRLYCRVLSTGRLAVGESVEVTPAGAPG